jgi:hypothetical protein
VQLVAFSNDIDTTDRSKEDIKKSFIALKTAADAAGLNVNNNENTTNMIVKKVESKQWLS